MNELPAVKRENQANNVIRKARRYLEDADLCRSKKAARARRFEKRQARRAARRLPIVYVEVD